MPPTVPTAPVPTAPPALPPAPASSDVLAERASLLADLRTLIARGPRSLLELPDALAKMGADRDAGRPTKS